MAGCGVRRCRIAKTGLRTLLLSTHDFKQEGGSWVMDDRFAELTSEHMHENLKSQYPALRTAFAGGRALWED